MEDMIQYVLSDRWDANGHIDRNQPGQDHLHREDEYIEQLKMSLFFRSMSYREDKISERHAQTFEWVFAEPRQSADGLPLWSSFPKWLEGDSSEIIWITGKPGSGKSTLVKFIAHDSRFRQSLTRWAEGSQLLTARFFSWSAGAERPQKTHEGLLRTLLLQVLVQDKSLTTRLFPGRLFLLQLFDRDVNFLPEPSIDELMRAFRALLSVTSQSVKLALIINGLDEFEDDHKELVSLLHEASSRPGVKICTSSRPWNVFKDEYINNPTLQLEKLTHDDIKLYVQERLQRSPGFQEFQVTNSAVAITIIEDLVEKARGVFLWVSIVSGLLETMFLEGCGPDDLRATIGSVPGEVSQLFMYIWDRTEPRFRTEASQYFQIKRAMDGCRFHTYALAFWLGDPAISVDMQVTDMTSEYISNAVNSLGRKLMSRTGGILEIKPGSEMAHSSIDYMHRTAVDWVEANWDSILASSTGIQFDPQLWLLKGEVLLTLREIELNDEKTDREWVHIINRSFELASRVKDTTSSRAVLGRILD